jgi:hypothetical protein
LKGAERASQYLTFRMFSFDKIWKVAAFRSPPGQASRKPKQSSVLSGTVGGRVIEEWLGEAAVIGFEIVP